VVWSRFASVVVLAILSSGPIWGAICAVQCASATVHDADPGSAHQHCAAADAAAEASAFNLRVHSIAPHDCSSHDTASRLTSTTASERLDRSLVWPQSASADIPTTFNVPEIQAPRFDRSRQHGAPHARATTPLVLRV